MENEQNVSLGMSEFERHTAQRTIKSLGIDKELDEGMQNLVAVAMHLHADTVNYTPTSDKALAKENQQLKDKLAKISQYLEETQKTAERGERAWRVVQHINYGFAL